MTTRLEALEALEAVARLAATMENPQLRAMAEQALAHTDPPGQVAEDVALVAAAMGLRDEPARIAISCLVALSRLAAAAHEAEAIRQRNEILERDLNCAGDFLRAQENRLALPIAVILTWAKRWERLRVLIERPPRPHVASKSVEAMLREADERAVAEGLDKHKWRAAALEYSARLDQLTNENGMATALLARERNETAALRARISALEAQLAGPQGGADPGTVRLAALEEALTAARGVCDRYMRDSPGMSSGAAIVAHDIYRLMRPQEDAP